MLFFLLLIIIEILSIAALREHFFNTSRFKYYISVLIHAVLSIWLWVLLIEINNYRGYYDSVWNIWAHMNLNGMICAVIFPRILLIILHFSGKAIRFRIGGHSRSLTNSGIIISAVIFLIFANGTITGRFNFKTEEVKVRVRGLNDRLNGLKIVQISDNHLNTFHHHLNLLRDVVQKINSYHPDIIINTGDFVTAGWREFIGSDTILATARSKYGNYAVFGNHDSGTYLQLRTDSALYANALKMNDMIHSSGYTVLNNEHIITDINGAKVAIIGVATAGRHPDIIHGDLKQAMAGLDSVDFKIFLCHDPNQWEEDVTGKTDIELTLAGHTHGMQVGILTKRFKWSPSKYFYPHWNGLYQIGNQYLFVNRGLGVLAIPARIWMPPEITVIQLEKE